MARYVLMPLAVPLSLFLPSPSIPCPSLPPLPSPLLPIPSLLSSFCMSVSLFHCSHKYYVIVSFSSDSSPFYCVSATRPHLSKCWGRKVLGGANAKRHSYNVTHLINIH